MGNAHQRATPQLVRTLENIVASVQRGEMIIITDHPRRENEGDFFVAAQCVTPQQINTMISCGRGMVCCPISARAARTLRLKAQTRRNHALHGTQFTVSVDAADCRGSGISAHDRAHTIRTLANPACRPEHLVRPGHIFPIVGHPSGLEARGGHTEAALALLELAQLPLVGVICEIINDHGEMARGQQLVDIARAQNMAIVSVEDIMHYTAYLGATGHA